MISLLTPWFGFLVLFFFNITNAPLDLCPKLFHIFLFPSSLYSFPSHHYSGAKSDIDNPDLNHCISTRNYSKYHIYVITCIYLSFDLLPLPWYLSVTPILKWIAWLHYAICCIPLYICTTLNGPLICC